MKLPKAVVALSRPLLAVLILAAVPQTFAANGDVLISQFRVDGPSSGNDEFVEVVNTGNSSVAIGGWTLQGCASGSGARSSRVTVAAGTTLAAGQYFLFTNSTAGAYTGGVSGDATYATGFSNSGNTGIALVASTSTSAAAVDSVGAGTGVCVEGTALASIAGANGFSRKNTATPANRAGVMDGNNNSTDFQSGTGTVHNSGSAPLVGSGGGATPSVGLSVTPASFAENGGSATVTATLSAASTAAVTVNLAFSGTATNATDYSASASTITIAAGSTSGSITLTAIDDSIYEGDETVVTSINGAPTGATTGSPNSVTATITDDDPMPPPVIGARIYQIQGASHVSPMNGMNVSNVPGIVTAVASNGFYMQDGDGDNDPKTSDAVLVFTSTAPTVTVGQEVLVSGVVTEFRPSNLATNLSTTEINSPTITTAANLFTNNTIVPTVIGTGGRLPPSEIIDDDSNGNVETSTSRVFDPSKEGIDFYESLEGMLVRFNNPVATDRTPGATGAATIWIVGDAGANATGRNARGGVTLVERAAVVDYNPEHVQLFTGLPGTNPGAAVSFNVGDQLASLNGVVSYFGGDYEILPTTTPALITPASTVRGVSSIASGGTRLTVGGYNVENLTVGDPQSKFDGLAADIVVSMGAPDIVSISEVQDNNGTTDAGVVDCAQTMAKLLAAINAKAGVAYSYDYRQIDPVDGQDGGAPTGNIRVVQIFNTRRVSFDDKAGGTSTGAVVVSADNTGKPTVNFSPGRIDPTNRAWANGNVTQPDGSVANYSGSRKPLVGEYTFNGRRLFVVSNHFNSRIGDDPLFGVNQPPRLLNEPQRREQALIVHNFVRDVLAIDSAAKIVVLGDFNEYDFGNPLRILRNGPLTPSGADGSEPVLKNLSTELVTDPAERYSYVFDGNSQELDHILVTPPLLTGTTQYQAVHLNAGYATQNSDHDPIVSSYVIAPNVAPTANAGGNKTVAPGAAATLSGSGTDSDGSIASYAWTQTAGPTVALSGADTATLSFTAPATGSSLSFTLTVTDSDGATGTDTAVVTVPADTSPDAFAFPASPGADPGSVQTSAAQTISGINTVTPISVTGGRYSLDGGAFTAAAGTITNGQRVAVQLTASSNFSTTTQAVLTVGDGSAAYSVTTRAARTTPMPFSFAPVTAAALGSIQTSGSIVVMGIEAPTSISITGGLFCINGNACTAMSGAVVNNGDQVRVQVVAATTVSTTKTATLTIGSIDGSFSVTTEATDTHPADFYFVPVTSAAVGSTQTSNAVQISGINSAAPISITGGSYSLNGGAFVSTAGTVSNGDSLQLRLIASSTPATATQAVVSIGGVAGSYSVTTAAADTTPTSLAFAPVTNAAPGSTQTSNPVTIDGINTAAPISVTGGSYNLNGSSFTTTAGNVRDGDVVRVQAIASSALATTTQAVLKVGSRVGTYSVTTAASVPPAPVVPAPPASGNDDGGGALNPLWLLPLVVLRRLRRKSRAG